MTGKKAGMTAAAVVTLLACAAWIRPQEPTAAAVLEKAIDDVLVQECFDLEITTEVQQGKGLDPFYVAYKGWVRKPDLTYLKMEGLKGTEIYSKGTRAMAKDGGRRGKWRDPGQGDDSLITDPMKYLREFKKYGAGAEFLPDDKLGDVVCRVIRARPPATAVKGMLGGLSIEEKDIRWENSTLVLRLWVGKADGLIRQAVADLDAESAVQGNPKAAPDRIKPRATFEIRTYNQPPKLDAIPEEVRAHLGIQ